MKRSALLFAFVLLIFATGIASAQRSDVTISGTGVLTNRVTGSGLAQTATTSGGFLLSYRHFVHHGGIEVSYGYTQNTQRYGGLFGYATAFVPVQTGISGITDIEVTSGLQEGDQIIVGSYKALRSLRPGGRIKVDNSPPKHDDTSSS